MKKKALVVLLIGILTISISACGASGSTADSSSKSESSAESVAEETGLFSGVGGWKAEEGIIMLLKADGSGAMLSEVSYEGDTTNLNIPSVFKTDITWEEDDETVSIAANDTEYSLQKKKDGGQETLELSGVSYVRLSDAEVNEYKEKAASVDSIEVPETTEDSSEELVLDEPITVIDNEEVTVKFTRFFSEVMNKGTSYEWNNAGFDIEVENKMDEYEVSLYPRDCSLSDRRVIEFAISGNNNVAAGKIATMTFTRLDQKPFEDLNALYELEGSFDLTVRDDKYSYSDLGGKREFSIPKALNAESIAAEASGNREAYAGVFAAISAHNWLFNGGGDAILNFIDFKENMATIGQVYFDGNGVHDNGVNEYAYIISDDSITVTTDGGELSIPYSLTGEEITLGSGEYYSLSEVEEGLQGYWTCKAHSDFGDTDLEYNFQVDHGTLRSESASEAMGGQPGEYYYYGPEEGSYTLGLGVFDTNMRHGNDWFFNIIDGKPVVLHYDTVCEPGSGFPGENGYSF